jgi:hypothetical protein
MQNKAPTVMAMTTGKTTAQEVRKEQVQESPETQQ